jgi:glutathione S-transferase
MTMNGGVLHKAPLDVLDAHPENTMAYELYYWPTIQGRGEFVRLALEEAGADYIDAARESEGVAVMLRMMEHADHPPFAPPFLKDGESVIGQTAAILLYLGARHGLAPKDPAGGLWTHQIQLTLSDFVAEAHDTHHPVGVGLYYEDQKGEALKRAKPSSVRRSSATTASRSFSTGSRRSSRATLQARGISSASLSPMSTFPFSRPSRASPTPSPRPRPAP